MQEIYLLLSNLENVSQEYRIDYQSLVNGISPELKKLEKQLGELNKKENKENKENKDIDSDLLGLIPQDEGGIDLKELMANLTEATLHTSDGRLKRDENFRKEFKETFKSLPSNILPTFVELYQLTGADPTNVDRELEIDGRPHLNSSIKVNVKTNFAEDYIRVLRSAYNFPDDLENLEKEVESLKSQSVNEMVKALREGLVEYAKNRMDFIEKNDLKHFQVERPKTEKDEKEYEMHVFMVSNELKLFKDYAKKNGLKEIEKKAENLERALNQEYLKYKNPIGTMGTYKTYFMGF